MKKLRMKHFELLVGREMSTNHLHVLTSLSYGMFLGLPNPLRPWLPGLGTISSPSSEAVVGSSFSRFFLILFSNRLNVIPIMPLFPMEKMRYCVFGWAQSHFTTDQISDHLTCSLLSLWHSCSQPYLAGSSPHTHLCSCRQCKVLEWLEKPGSSWGKGGKEQSTQPPVNHKQGFAQPPSTKKSLNSTPLPQSRSSFP